MGCLNLYFYFFLISTFLYLNHIYKNLRKMYVLLQQQQDRRTGCACNGVRVHECGRLNTANLAVG